MGVGARQLPARRRDRILSSPASRKSRSTSRPAAYQIARLPGGCGRRHRHQSAQPRRPGPRPLDAGHRPCARPEEGLRPALRRAAGEALLPEPAADHPRRAGRHATGPRSTCRIPKRRLVRAASASRRSAAGACAMLNAISAASATNVPPRAGDARHDSDVARSRRP